MNNSTEIKKVLAGWDMVSDSRRALMRRYKFKVSSLQKKGKKERPSENMDLTGKQFEASDQKITEKRISKSD